MKPTTLLELWSSSARRAVLVPLRLKHISIQKADNSFEERIAAARSDEGWSHLLKSKLHQSLEFAAWGNGRGRGWANGGGGGGGSANARYGGGWGNGGRWRNGSGAWGNGGGRRGFVNW
jgi:rSAM-associated Gly-rich repeat protein